MAEQSCRTRVLLSDGFLSYLGHSLRDGVLPLCRDAVSILNKPSQSGWLYIVWYKSEIVNMHLTESEM